LHNGNIWTVDSLLPRAQAVAMSGGRFTAVGSNDDVLHLAAGRTRKIDLAGKTVLPGSTTLTLIPLNPALSTCAWSPATRIPSPKFKKLCASAPPKLLPANGCLAFFTTT